MTPREIELLRVMLREEVTIAIAPVKAELADLGERTKKLEDAKRKHSGEVHAITRVAIPQMQSEAERIRRGDMGGIADAFDKMVHVVNDVADNVSAMRTELQPRATLALPDGKGGTSIRPASLVAAESSVRTEVKQDGIAKVVVDAAIDTTKAKNDAASAKKRITVTMIGLIVQGLIMGAWAAWQAIAHAGIPH